MIHQFGNLVWDPINAIWVPEVLGNYVWNSASSSWIPWSGGASSVSNYDSYVFNSAASAWVPQSDQSRITKSTHVLCGPVNVAALSASKSAELDVSTSLAVLLCIDFAPRSGSAPTASTIRVETSAAPTGDGAWVTLPDFVMTTGVVAAAASTGSSGTSGAATIIAASGASGSFASGDSLFFLNSNVSLSEWRRVTGASNGSLISFDLLDALTYDQSSSPIFSKAERNAYQLFCDSVRRIRVTAFSGSQPITWRCLAVTGDSIGN